MLMVATLTVMDDDDDGGDDSLIACGDGGEMVNARDD